MTYTQLSLFTYVDVNNLIDTQQMNRVFMYVNFKILCLSEFHKHNLKLFNDWLPGCLALVRSYSYQQTFQPVLRRPFSVLTNKLTTQTGCQVSDHSTVSPLPQFRPRANSPEVNHCNNIESGRVSHRQNVELKINY